MVEVEYRDRASAILPAPAHEAEPHKPSAAQEAGNAGREGVPRTTSLSSGSATATAGLLYPVSPHR